MKRVLSVLLLLATSMAAVCGDTTEPNANASVVGSWTMTAINGDPLPAPLNDGGSIRNMTAGSFTANANGTFSYSETSTEDGVDAITGTWVAASAANTFTFTPNEIPGEGVPSNGTVVVSGNTATLTIANSPGVTRAFSRN